MRTPELALHTLAKLEDGGVEDFLQAHAGCDVESYIEDGYFWTKTHYGLMLVHSN